MKAHQYLQAASNVVAALIGLAIGAALAGHTGAEPWLYRWQTILAGALAVAAAAMTVMATLTADRRQHGRHNQILALNLRSDVRRIERAVHPRARAILRLRDFIDHQFAQIVGYISVVQTGSAPSHNDTLDLISWGIEACFNRIRAAVDPEGLADAIPVLNGAAMESLQRVKLRLREVEEMVEIYRRYAATYDRQAMSANADTLAATLRGAEAAAMELRQYLLDIESEYRAAHIALAGNH